MHGYRDLPNCVPGFTLPMRFRDLGEGIYATRDRFNFSLLNPIS